MPRLFALLMLLLVCVAPRAEAVTVQYTLDAEFNDTGTATGTFLYDGTTIWDVTITTTAGTGLITTGTTYDSATASGATFLFSVAGTPGRTLTLNFNPPLSISGTQTLVSGAETVGLETRTIVAGSAEQPTSTVVGVVVPLPTSVILLLSGLVGVGVLSARRRGSNQRAG